MKSRVTIAGAGIRHNRAEAVSGFCPRTLAVRAASWISMLGAALLGCAATPPPSAEIPVWELAYAEPVKPAFVGRARVSFDRPLPEHLTRRLCDEFSLVTIREAADWADVRRRLQLQHDPLNLDLSQGAIVGILANVGECAHGRWPVQLHAVRTRSGQGWVEASFTSGLYYPLRAAGYLELAYVPGLRTVRMVRIGHRTFMIRTATASH